MSVKLRLRRMGRKKLPMYRIVAVDSRDRRDGKYLEKVGFYNPLPDPVDLEIDKEKAMKWLNRGAIPSDTVKSFLQRKGIMLEWDLRKRGYDDEKIEEELKKWEIVQLEHQKRLEAQAAMKMRKDDEKEAAEEVAATEEAVAETVEAAKEDSVEAVEEPAETLAEVEPETKAEETKES
ncbi:MAG: 30S ribosomal protein S16 [Actinobacteria bacterium]|nr:30S ribosomal protein S16 [Actinomycetota bacterium]